MHIRTLELNIVYKNYNALCFIAFSYYEDNVFFVLKSGNSFINIAKKSGNLSANTLQKSGNQEIKIINKGDINLIDFLSELKVVRDIKRLMILRNGFVVRLNLRRVMSTNTNNNG